MFSINNITPSQATLAAMFPEERYLASPPPAQEDVFLTPPRPASVHAISMPTTPIKALPAPECTPLITPPRRYTYKKSENHWSSLGLFTPGTKKTLQSYQKKKWTIIYSLKLSFAGQEYRYIGETHRPLQRASNHAANKGSEQLVQMKQACQKSEESTFSIGILGIYPPGSSKAKIAEEKARAQCETAGLPLLNQRKGGGGGESAEEPTLSDTQAEKLLRNRLTKPIPKRGFTRLHGSIKHTLSKEEQTEEKVLYVFERALPSGGTKRLVGYTGQRILQRLSTYLSHANNPKKVQRKDKSFFEDFHTFWSQFTIKVIPVKDIVAKGATLGQLETIAISIFDGMRGYNKNRGGGGGSSRQ